MTLTIDNLDGLGAVDYSCTIDASEPLAITRVLNQPSVLKGMLCLEGTLLKTPVRQARIVVRSESGTVLFTGYLTVEPVAVYAGVASEGPVYRLAVSAVSDEWLLDKQSAGTIPGEAFGSTASVLFTQLVSRIAPGLLATTAVRGGQPVGVFKADAGSVLPSAAESAVWSKHAGTVASTTYAAYRAVDGALALTPAGSVVHTLSDGDGSLAIAGLQQSAVRELANDVTLSGAMEPAAYWTELFLGDGTTTVFNLTGEPNAPANGRATLISDSFPGATLNPNTWALSDPGSHLSLAGGGLTMNGGNGLDGQTTVLANDQIELGGTVVIELDSVSLAAGSAGVVAGLYEGLPVLANCVAGFSVAQSGGNTVLQPIVNGTLTGRPFPVSSASFYTLRLHLHSPELLRVKQAYYAFGANNQVTSFGGGLSNAPLQMVFELRDQAASSNTPVTVLYDGAMASSAAQASLAVVNSLELFGSIGAVTVTRTGTAWVTSTPPGESSGTRLVGKTAQGVDCTLTGGAEGHVTFMAGRVPVANEAVTVGYRGSARAVARLADPASLAAEAAGGAPGTARWVGKVLEPVARSSEDCENGAAAVLSFATSRAAAVSGSYTAVRQLGEAGGSTADIWPGDLLELTANDVTTSGIVRKVVVEERGASPEALTYRIAFANDWAEGLGIQLSEAIAVDALLPATALDLTPPAAPGQTATLLPHTLENLNQITVAGGASTLIADAGIDPPTGGGFEVRRRDAGFGTGAAASAGSGDLVLRSPVRGFTLPRAAVEETFFVRMYDASTPPLYSRASAAIVTHLPLA